MPDRSAPDGSALSPVRVGLLLDPQALRLTRWQRECLQNLAEGRDTELCVLVAGSAPASGHPKSSGFSLWRAYNNGWVARRSRAIQRLPAGDLLGQVPVIHVQPELRGRYSQHLPAEAIEQIRAYDLDVLLRFGFGILRGEILDVPRYGVWSFHHDDDRVIRGGPPGFWEVYEGLPTTGVLFQRLTDRLDAGVPLERAVFRTVGYSYPRNRDESALGAAVLPAKVARAVRDGWLDPNVEPESPTTPGPLPPIRRNPTNRQMARFLWQQSGRAVSARARSVLVGDRWGIGVAPGHPSMQPPRLSDVEWLPEPPHPGYFADPFPAARDGVTALLVEQFDERTGQGVISAIESTAAGWRHQQKVLDPGVHASYPFLLEVDGDLYCIPETAQAHRVQAWRSVRFPVEWEPGPVLLEAPVLDPTIVEWDGVWWMFGTRRDRYRDGELWLWHAPHPLGPWTQHAANPMKIDVTSSRPAGTPFVVDGVLYRPAQDCSEGYGSAIVINRVDRLSTTHFEEALVSRFRVGGQRYPAGSHTLSFGAGLVAVDSRRNVFSAHRSARELRARLKRLG